MAIKWKGWTARKPVKICCVLLIPVMAFMFLLGALGLARMNLNYDEGILFTDFRNSDYFFDAYAPNALLRVQTVFGYQSEEHIRSMGCLAWQPTEDYYVDENGAEEQWLALVSTNLVNMRQKWGNVRASDLESPAAIELLEEAINNQLNDYYYAMEWLDTTSGLYYYIEDESRSLTNVPQQDAEFFRAQPVYLLEENGRLQEQSRQSDNRYNYGYYGSADNTTVYIAFSGEAVDYWNSVWRDAQRQIVANLALMAAPVLAALALLIILIMGTGRRCGDDSGAVHFTVLDKPWLDFGLVALVCYEVAICAFIYYSVAVAWRYDNIRWIVLLCALLSACFTLPLLAWVSNFAKRCKDGKWWHYTLLHWIYDKCNSFIKSLWAGFPLTVKSVLAGIALFVAAVVIAQTSLTEGGLLLCLLLAAAATVLLLQHARRLYRVEQGAKAAGSGVYDAPIAVTGGELGSIAASINRISSGINAAVAERMKSERLKTELITNVSHDIRTPLTSLITYTDLLKSEGLDSAKAPEYLDVLIQKSARLKTLTDDLFEAAKAASGNIEVHLDSLDLADFVRQVLGELDERVSESGLDFRLNLPEHAPVRADGKLLWRVMENLLSNVFKYAHTGSRVYIDVMPENGEYRLEVKNISEHPLNVDPSELTERFKRGDSARTDEGSGLGLSIAQSFVQAQGGRFALSIDGDLFKATLRLPRTEAAFV